MVLGGVIRFVEVKTIYSGEISVKWFLEIKDGIGSCDGGMVR